MATPFCHLPLLAARAGLCALTALLLAAGHLPAAGPRAAELCRDLPGVDRGAVERPVHAELLRDLADGRLDSRSLVAAALVAEGIERPAELARLLARWETQRAALVAAARPAPTPAAQAEAALTGLFAAVLTGAYDAPCSETRRALDDGDYNCVTATILYLDLCAALDLEAEPLGRPGHVCCRVRLGRATDDTWQHVETTCARWFTHLRNGQTPPLPHGSGGELQPLTSVQLLAKVYYNRAGEHLDRHEFAAAVPWIDLAWRLDPADRRAKENLLATLNNGALQLARQGDRPAALAWIAAARALDPAFAPLRANEQFLRSGAVPRAD